MTDAFEETAWLNVVLFAENDQARVALYTRPDPEVPAPTALRLAISHIEHMAAWIAADNRGYSFEALGEDMATIKAGLTATPEGLREAIDWLALEAANLERSGARSYAGRGVDAALANAGARLDRERAARFRVILAALQPQAEGGGGHDRRER